MLNHDFLPPAQQLRALVGYLGLGERAAAIELGISRTLLRAIFQGVSLPDGDCRQRIKAMSQRWPHGVIGLHDWPRPAPVDRRKTKPKKAEMSYRVVDPILSPEEFMGSEATIEVSPPDDYLDEAPDELEE
jgi:hypothetical protein